MVVGAGKVCDILKGKLKLVDADTRPAGGVSGEFCGKKGLVNGDSSIWNESTNLQ